MKQELNSVPRVVDLMRTRPKPEDHSRLKYAAAIACVVHLVLLYMIFPEFGTKEIQVPEEIPRVQLRRFQPPPPPQRAPTPPPQKQVKQKKVKQIKPIPDQRPDEPDVPQDIDVELTVEDVPDIQVTDFMEDFDDFALPSAMGMPGPAEPLSHGYDMGSIGMLEEIKPVYPAVLKEMRVEGRAVVRILINEDGTVDEDGTSVLTSTHEYFEEPALEAALKTRFNPPKDLDGNPARVYWTNTYRFTLK